MYELNIYDEKWIIKQFYEHEQMQIWSEEFFFCLRLYHFSL